MRTNGMRSFDPVPALPLRSVCCLVAGFVLFLATFAIFQPGYAMYDSVAQYGQAVGGVYDDWHPPAMARLWGVFGAHGSLPMFAVQTGLYWFGLGLIAAALARQGRTRAAVAMLGIGAWPPFLGWQVVVLKDTQMLGAMLAAVGIVAWWRLRGMRVPIAAATLAGLLLCYAILVRANAAFAAVPLAINMIGRPVDWRARGLAMGGGVLVVLALAPVLNHKVMRASPSGVERTQALYDLAGIAAHTGAVDVGLQRQEIATIVARGCAKPFFWDPLGDDMHCGPTMERLRTMSPGTLYAMLVAAIVRHPVAYADHRLAHVNSTDRWLVPFGWPSAGPPVASEPNTLGLGSPARVAAAWQRLSAWVIATPLGWPIVWIVIAVGALATALPRPRGATRDLALALLVSALTLEASFGVLSIASDLRYHLWPMVATALAIVLLADIAVPRRIIVPGAAALAIVIGTGVASRLMLPSPPQSYTGMLG